jgi:TRAP-type C4-dicarboxylate transport system permease small subunit
MNPHSEFADPQAVLVPRAGAPKWLVALEARVGAAVEAAAALLVVAEVAILFAGVVSRYVLHRPLLWSDELASILFLWMAMLGAVVALRRGEHMRMTAIVGMVSPPVRAFLDVLAIAAALAFLALIVYPAYEFAHDEMVITTPALEITNAWRAAALPVGSALMLVVALMRLLEAGSWRLIAGSLAVIGVAIGILLVLQPVLF